MSKFLESFPFLQSIFEVVSNILSVSGLLLMTYVFCILCIIAIAILRLKVNNPFKVIHIVSVVEVYIFICFLLAIILIAKVHGLLLLKFILFGIIVAFNGITATRLVAKTAYFYGMRSKGK